MGQCICIQKGNRTLRDGHETGEVQTLAHSHGKDGKLHTMHFTADTQNQCHSTQL